MFTARWKKLKEAALSNLIVNECAALNIRLKKKLVLSKISPQSSRNEFSIAHMCFDRSTFPEENKGLVKGRSLESGTSPMVNRGPFLQSPGNFSGPKSNIQIEIKGIKARVLASKILH